MNATKKTNVSFILELTYTVEASSIPLNTFFGMKLNMQEIETMKFKKINNSGCMLAVAKGFI